MHHQARLNCFFLNFVLMLTDSKAKTTLSLKYREPCSAGNSVQTSRPWEHRNLRMVETRQAGVRAHKSRLPASAVGSRRAGESQEGR